MIRKSFPSAIEQTDPRTFVATVSTGSMDRDGDCIDPKGWQLASYRHNPIVNWQHNMSLPPIARATDIRVQGGALVAKMEFPPPGISPLADEICGLVKAGFLHSTSVGFRAIRSTPNGIGRNISEAELMEFSVVSIPSQVEARISRCMGEACNEMKLKSWLGGNWRTQQKETYTMETEEMWLEIDDEKDLDTHFEEMLAMMNTGSRHSVTEDLAVQMRRLGPKATIADLCRAVMQGVVAPSKRWRGDDEEIDVDLKEVNRLAGRVVAEALPGLVRAALCQATGRLD